MEGREREGRSEGVGLFPGKYSICEANFVTYREFSLFVPLTKSNLSLRSCVTGLKINSLLPSTTPFRHAEAIHFFSFFSIVAPPPHPTNLFKNTEVLIKKVGGSHKDEGNSVNAQN